MGYNKLSILSLLPPPLLRRENTQSISTYCFSDGLMDDECSANQQTEWEDLGRVSGGCRRRGRVGWGVETVGSAERNARREQQQRRVSAQHTGLYISH